MRLYRTLFLFMKYFLAFLILFAAIISCQKEVNGDIEPTDTIKPIVTDTGLMRAKIDGVQWYADKESKRCLFPHIA